MKIGLIIPAHNEANRIIPTLHAYHQFLSLQQADNDQFFLTVVLNGCTDNSFEVLHQIQHRYPHLTILDVPHAGKGLAIKKGFEYALQQQADLIGYVDADMATRPEHFYDLLQAANQADGIIASRYMPGAFIEPQRPRVKRWGSKLVYEPLIRLLFGLRHYDYQCGAKLFHRNAIEKVTPYLTVTQWAFDLELLYLCKKHGFTIKEIPTTWFDQSESKLRIFKAGLPMLRSLFSIRRKHG